MRFILLLATCVAMSTPFVSHAEELIQLERNHQLTLTEVVRLSILRSPKPVSYTHLDVYKRQPIQVAKHLMLLDV